MDTSTQPRAAFTAAPLLILLALLGIIALGFWFFLRAPATPPQQSLLTPEARAYVKHLGLSEVEMKATESYMKNTLVEITGKLTNKGDRTLRLVEINCLFYDMYGQLVLRERVLIVRRAAGGGLKPGETRPFRLPFDTIPMSWNQILPQLVIARIDFE